MALSDITNKIESDASEKAERILREAKDAEQAIYAEVEEKKKTLTNEYETRTAERLSRNETRVADGAAREGKQYVENEKRQLLDDVFANALQKLEGLPSKDYTDFITKLLEVVSGEKGTVNVYAPENREKETKDALAAAKITADVHVDKKMKGGLRVEGENFEYDFTFHKLMDQKRDELEVEVAKVLFS